VDTTYGSRRLDVARAFLKAARDVAALTDEAAVGNPIVSQAVTAAIAYADAITAARLGRVDQQDHDGVHKMLRDALGKRLPEIEARRLRRILGMKDAAQYGARLLRKDEAVGVLEETEAFANWAEAELTRR
jgi:hypothetical protein